MAICVICRQTRNNCKVFTLTAAEREAYEAKGIEAPDELTYCQPCWKTLSDPVSGPAFAKGLLQAQLRSVGVGNAEDVASKYHVALLEMARKPRS